MEFDAFSIDTQAIPERDRMDVFHEFFRTANGMDVSLFPDAAPTANLDALLLPGLGTGRGHIGRLVGNRTGQLLSDGNRSIVISKFSSGFLGPSAGGEMMRIDPDRPVVTALDEPRQFVYDRAGTITSVWFDPCELATLLPSFSFHGFEVLGDRAPATNLLFTYADTLRLSPLKSAEMVSMAAQHLRELALLVLGQARDVADIVRGDGVRAARLLVLKRDIDALGHMPGFTIGALADKHGISARYVQKLFEMSGVTFSEYLLERRLGFVLRQLTDPDKDRLAIADIAFQAGFHDLSVFNRQFRRRFGGSPSGVRAARLSL